MQRFLGMRNALLHFLGVGNALLHFQWQVFIPTAGSPQRPQTSRGSSLCSTRVEQVLARGQGSRPCHNFSARANLVRTSASGGSSSLIHVSLGRSWMLNRWFPAFVIAKPPFPIIFSVFVLSSQQGIKMNNLSEACYTFSVLFLYIVTPLS